MKAHPFSVLKAAGWVLDSAGSPTKPSRRAWSRTETITLRRGESSVVCSPLDSTFTFHVCHNGHCEDFMVPYADTDSLRKLATAP